MLLVLRRRSNRLFYTLSSHPNIHLFRYAIPNLSGYNADKVFFVGIVPAEIHSAALGVGNSFAV